MQRDGKRMGGRGEEDRVWEEKGGEEIREDGEREGRMGRRKKRRKIRNRSFGDVNLLHTKGN